MSKRKEHLESPRGSLKERNSLKRESASERIDDEEKKEGKGAEKEEEQEEKEEYVPDKPYSPPTANYVFLIFGDHEKVMLNFNCRLGILIDYVRHKASVTSDHVDLCDAQGQMVGLLDLGLQDDVRDMFQPAETYFPCVVTRDEEGTLMEIRPAVEDWEELYPEVKEQLQKTVEASQAEAAARAKVAEEARLRKEREQREKERKEEKQKKEEAKKQQLTGGGK